MEKLLERVESDGVQETRKRFTQEALQILETDIAVNRKIGMYGKKLIKEGDGVLTHCNAGALATGGFGTALGVIYAAWDEGRKFQVFVDETRPMLQGCRLTAWELVQEKIPATLITDNMAGVLMRKGMVHLVVVGADRIARNGDTANKIGTYGLAVLSKSHGIPFYVAAPASTLDLSLVSGEEIPIEQRDTAEVTHFRGRPIAPKGVKAFNPAFDVTPHSLIHGIITEKGIIRKPFRKNLRKMFTAPQSCTNRFQTPPTGQAGVPCRTPNSKEV
jgi:methylthioribose-1-phosphate isomerase